MAWATLQRSTAGADLRAKASSGSEMKTGSAVCVRSPPPSPSPDEVDPRSSGMRSRGSLLLEDFFRCVEGGDTPAMEKAGHYNRVGCPMTDVMTLLSSSAMRLPSHCSLPRGDQRIWTEF